MRDELQRALRWKEPANLGEQIRKRGLGNFCLHLLRGARRRIFALYREIVVVKDIGTTKPFAGTERVALHVVRHPTDEALQDLADRMGRNETMERKLSAYAKNRFRCFIALHGAIPIGHIWWVNASDVLRRPHPHLARFEIDLRERDAYLFDFVLLPAHRGGGNATEFFGKVEEELRQRGYTRVFGFVTPNNKQARWFYALQGWRDLKTIDSYLLLTRVLFTPAGVSIRNGARNPTHPYDFRLIRRRPRGRRLKSTTPDAGPTTTPSSR